MKRLNVYGVNALLSPLKWIAVCALCFFTAAGSLRITRAWVYIIVYAAGGIAGGLYVLKKNKEVLNARGRFHAGTKRWDIPIVAAYFLFALVLVPLVSGFDARFSWSPLPAYTICIGLALYLVSMGISFSAMACNPFMEGTARIQRDRRQTIVDSGPYAIIRHPAYLGMIAGAWAQVLALGSCYAMAGAAVQTALVLLRTHLEDCALQKELPGYKEYALRVRYRLLPFVW